MLNSSISSYSKILLSILLISVFSNFRLHSATQENNILDSTKTNNSKILQTDTVKLYKTNKDFGSLFEVTDTITFRTISQTAYSTATGILSQKQTLFPLNTGIIGNSNYLSVYCASPYENSLSLNNINYSDCYGAGNYDIISPEFVNKIEFLTGAKSVILSGKSGATINIQTPIFDVKNPYTRLWYIQGDNKLIGVDGTFSQNFLANWNLTAGFRRLSANNSYPNSFFDSWNARLMLRKNISNFSTLSVLYHFSNYHTGDFGGILFSDYNTNNNSTSLVRSNFSDLQNRQYRTDLVLTYSTVILDTTFTINSNLFFNHNENNIFFHKQAELIKIDSNGRNTTDAVNYGINTHFKYLLNKNFSLVGGGELFYLLIPNSLITTKYSGIGYKVYGLSTIDFSSVDLSLGARYASKYDKQLVSFGGILTKHINHENSRNKFYLDASFNSSEPIPTFNYDIEKHILALFGFQHLNQDFSIDVNLFYRNTSNPLLLKFDKANIYSFSPLTADVLDYRSGGLTSKINFTIIKNFECDVTVQGFLDNRSLEEKNHYKPKCYLTGKLQYSYLKGTSRIYAGLSASFLINDTKLYYNPIFKSYSVSDLENSFSTNGLNLFLSAKLGNAFVRVSFNNVIGTDFSYLAYCPLPKRELCLSLTWAFPN